MDISGVSTALKTYREREHLYQKEMAAKLRISRVYYCQLENGKANPSLRLFSKIIHMTGIQLSTVFTHVDNLDENICNLCYSLHDGDRKTVKRMIKRMSQG